MVDDVTSGLLVMSPWRWWPWHCQHGQTHLGYVDDITDPPPSHPGSSDTIVFTKTAAG